MPKGLYRGQGYINNGKGFYRGVGIMGVWVPPPSAVTGGSITPVSTETDIVNGGKVLTLTLFDATWVAAGAAFDAQRQAILDGITADTTSTNGWNNEVRDKESVTAVVRTSDTIVTITFSAAASYSIDTTETITATIPASAIVEAQEVVATPTFWVLADAPGPIRLMMNSYRRRRT
jgi:hypothetical protein